MKSKYISIVLLALVLLTGMVKGEETTDARIIESYVLNEIDVKIKLYSPSNIGVFVENKNYDVVFDGDIVLEVVANLSDSFQYPSSKYVSVFNPFPIIYKEVKHVVVGPYGVKKVSFEIPSENLNLITPKLTYNVYAINNNKQLIGFVNAHTTPAYVILRLNSSSSNAESCYIDRIYSNIGGSYGSAGPLVLGEEVEGYLRFVCSNENPEEYVLEGYVCDYWDTWFFKNKSKCKLIYNKEISLSKDSEGEIITLKKKDLPYDANALLFLLKKENKIADMFTSRLIMPHENAHLIEWTWSEDENPYITIYATYTGPYFPVNKEGTKEFNVCAYYLNESKYCITDSISAYTDRVVLKEYKVPKENLVKVCIEDACKNIASPLYSTEAEKEYESLFMKKLESITSNNTKKRIDLYSPKTIIFFLTIVFVVMALVYMFIKYKTRGERNEKLKE